MVDTINGYDTNQDLGGVETPTVEEAKDNNVTQELQNSVAMNQSQWLINQVMLISCQR